MIDNSTIAAISTPPGTGAIAIVRLSGESALKIADSIFQSPSGKKLASEPANTLHYGSVHDNDTIIDEVVIGLFKTPHSYTGEDLVEISCHGSLYIQQRILELLTTRGARLAQPGEFTLRAFLNGKMDLSQAEAVADLIASTSKSLHRVAMNQMRGGFKNELNLLRQRLLRFISLIELELDFSEEDVEFADRESLRELTGEIETLLRKLRDSFSTGNAIKHGIPVAIIGRTNAGKSTLLNLLLNEEKAIVSEIEGTTRDFIEDTISVGGTYFRFIDTAGLRHSDDKIEKLGIERTYQKIDQAGIILLVTDATASPDDVLGSVNEVIEKTGNTDKKLLVIVNKTDSVEKAVIDLLVREIARITGVPGNIIAMSAKNGENLNLLEKVLASVAHAGEPDQDNVIVTNVRHFEALGKSHAAILRAIKGLEDKIPVDLLAQDIREVLHYLGEITGEITNDEILGNIFRNFCIGK